MFAAIELANMINEQFNVLFNLSDIMNSVKSIGLHYSSLVGATPTWFRVIIPGFNLMYWIAWWECNFFLLPNLTFRIDLNSIAPPNIGYNIFYLHHYGHILLTTLHSKSMI